MCVNPKCTIFVEKNAYQSSYRHVGYENKEKVQPNALQTAFHAD